MRRAKIKVCGIVCESDIEKLSSFNVSYVGMVFHEESKRYVDLARAEKIAKKAREFKIEPVAVFTHHSMQKMQKIVETLSLKTIQLHGEVSLKEQSKLPKELSRIYAFHVHENGELEERLEVLKEFRKGRDYLLYDGMEPGSGKFFSWADFEPIEGYPFFLAGGLKPSNVKEAILQTHPYAVDVSSGVEDENGRKSLPKIQAFVEEVESVFV